MRLTITDVFNQLDAKPLKPMIEIDFWYFHWLYYNDVETFNYSINVLISWFIWATSQEHELEMLEGQHTTGWITLTVSKLHCIVLFCLANKTFPFLSSSFPKTRDGVFFGRIKAPLTWTNCENINWPCSWASIGDAVSVKLQASSIYTKLRATQKSQNNKMVWVGSALKYHPVPSLTALPQGHVSVDQVSQGLIQPGLQYFMEGASIISLSNKGPTSYNTSLCMYYKLM